MAFYLMRFSYTPETWSKLIQNPEDRRDAARAYIEQVGGALHGFWYGFGKYDGYAIFEAPDNVSVAGVVLAITAGGALASVETTVLMSVEEMLEALAKANTLAAAAQESSQRPRLPALPDHRTKYVGVL
jgi:uncharacterized protein with GYD domain